MTADTRSTMPAALAVAGMTKSFGAVRAVRDVSLQFAPGEVTALLGENGAGKSTLIRLCSGEMRPDAGQLMLGGKPVTFAGPLDAIEAGVVVVHQEPMLIGELTIADNLFLPELGKRSAHRLARRSDTVREGRALLERLGLAGYLPDAATKCRDLSAAARQMVDIARALSRDPRVLFLDEPNSSLTQEESERLFAVARRMRDDGVAVVLVSHRLAEVFSIADRVIVLRDGSFVASGTPDEIDEGRAIALMAGEPKLAAVEKVAADRDLSSEQRPVALELRGLSGPGFSDIDLTVHRGEIVGMAGLVGAGRTEIAEAVLGLRDRTAGDILVTGRPVRIGGPRRAQQLGIAYVGEERRTEVFHMQSVGFNLTARVFDALARLGWVRTSRTGRTAHDLVERFGVKTASPRAPITSLSGGNQQKVLLARALAARPRVLILDEPTRGVDVGTKADIYSMLRELAHTEGLAVWFISSELEEVVELADRVVVIRQGRVTRDAPNNEGPNPIVAAAMGAHEG